MGTLLRAGDDFRWALTSHNVIGRARDAELQIDEPYVSREHAVVVYSVAAGWEAKDLGSRNGTSVDGAPLGPGEWRALPVGGEITFGDADEVWRLVEEGPPLPFAIAPGGEQRVTEDGLLTLPDASDPVVTVFDAGEGAWRLERADVARAALDREPIEVGGVIWRLRLPAESVETVTVRHPSIRNIGLRFQLSRDEEYGVVTLLHQGDRTPIPYRAYSYMLVMLARLRLDAARADRLPAAEQGWIHQDDLARMLGIDRPTLNVHVMRARKQLARHGVKGAAGIIERRAGTGLLRIGVSAVTVESL